MLAATSIETSRHSDDVELITSAMCEKLGLSEAERESVLAAARLHDIGKMAMPPEVLEKPGPLNAEEWRLIRRHTVIGEQILSSVNDLQDVARLVRHSHERWDGDGYPDGLEGEQIPLGSRIVFCADAFHAIRSDRAYRPGASADHALGEVRRNSGTQFDPRVVDALTEVVRELRIAPARQAHLSPRLAALLLVLCLGLAGSAIGRSALLGEAQVRAPKPAGAPAPLPLACPSADCSFALGPAILAGFAPVDGAPAKESGRSRVIPGSVGPRVKRKNDGDADGGSTGAGQGESQSVGGSAGSGSNGGSAGGNGNGNANGNGNSGGNSQGNAGGGSKAKTKTNGGGSNKVTGGGSGPTGGGNASSQTGSPGNSGNAPGHNK